MRPTRRLPLATGIALLTTLGTRAFAGVPPSVLAAAEHRMQSSFARRGLAYPPRGVTLIALKAEARLELWADSGTGWTFVRSYLVRAASGRLGPKLREGDHQVPEGIYRIDALNPDSRYHLSLHVDYPSPFDRTHAAEDQRARLGGDIMIHGGSLSDGCLPIGDAAVEEVYALAARVETPNVAVIIGPFDFRRVSPEVAMLRAGERPPWLGALYETLAAALQEFARPEDPTSPARARRTVVARPACKAYDEGDCVRRCRTGDAQSCARAGLMYRQGRGVAMDVAKAWTFLQTACDGGDGLGCAELGQLYLGDDGLRRDASRAAELAALACDAGDGHGCSDLVSLCAGRLIYPAPADQCSADALRRLAARAVATLQWECSGWGAYDCDTLATMYSPGDPETALRFASRSCQGGDPGGCDDLGRLYENEGDATRARALYRRACDAGYATACEHFGAAPEG
jgi:TPR repeat protein